MRAMFVCALALAVAGCGGGGGSATMAAAQLAGTVYEVDGQSTDLAGVPVMLKETGEWTWTDASGSFEFSDLEGGTYTLDFMGDGDDDAEEGDEFEDGDGDPKVDVPDGGRVECDVALEDGKVKDFSSGHEEGQYAMARLHLTDAGWLEGFRLEGAIKIGVRGDGTLFKVCIEGLEGGTQIDIHVGEVFLGTAAAVEGRACLVLENELSPAALRELAGVRVDVYLYDSELRLMVGEIPSLKEDDGEDGDDKPDGEEPGDDGEEPDEGEDGDKPDGDDGDEGDGDKPGEDGTEGEGEGDGEECEEPSEDGEGDGEEPGDGADGEGGEDGVD